MKSLMRSAFLVLLSVALIMGMSSNLKAATIDKDMAEDGYLGDIIPVTLTVNNDYGAPVRVIDMIPPGLKYIPMTLVVEGTGVHSEDDPEDNTIDVTVSTDGNGIITFEVQVVEVQSVALPVTNTASVYEGNDPDSADDASVVITLYPYEGFSKEVVSWKNSEDWDEVLINTDVHWLLLIQIVNIDDEIVTMSDVLVKDNLGGDLEMHLCYSDCPFPGKVLLQPPSLAPTFKKKGNTEKLQLEWNDIADLEDGDSESLYLEVSTDVNPGQGKKSPPKLEYTEAGEHDLNSGATLKFIDSEGTGFQLSAHTASITVVAVEPPPE